MPFATDRKKLDSPFLDRRVKLLPCQKEMVKWWHDRGHSIRGLARMFKVDKRTIQFILFPERHQRNLETRHDLGGSMAYYVKEKHATAIREHRRYKHDVLS